MKAEKKYRIVAACNPYHARWHYTGGAVLKREGNTPVKWVHDDNYGLSYTLEEAHQLLDSYAREMASGNNDYHVEDSESIEDLIISEMEELGLTRKEVEEEVGKWFVGVGLYHLCNEVYLFGDDYIEDDVVTYSIDEYSE